MRVAVAGLAVALVALLVLAVPTPTLPASTASSSPHAALLTAPSLAQALAARGLPTTIGIYPLTPGPGRTAPSTTPVVGSFGGRSGTSPDSGGAIVAGPDLANPVLGTLSYGATVAAVGPTNATILVGTENESYFLSGSGLFWTYGLSAAFRTSTGGVTWTTSWVGPNASWTDRSSTSWGDITWGATSVAGENGTALYATTYASPCAVFYPTGPCANSTLEAAAPAGVAVARSTDGGASWAAPVPIDDLAEYRYVEGFCPNATGPYSGYIPANITDQPSVAIAPDGAVAVVGWDVLDYTDSVECISGQAYYFITALDDLSQVSVSTNRGGTWSAPVTIGSGASGPVSVAIGASPADTIAYTYEDLQNGTSSTFPYAIVLSTNLGATWSHPTDLGASSMVHPVVTSAPDAFEVATLPRLAADDNLSSPFAGALYLAWADNRTSVDGDPSIAVALGTVHGGWSGVRYVTAAGGSSIYFDPSITVAPSGRVWLVYYQESLETGAYQLVGRFSDTGGLSWSPAFGIADGPSYPTSADTFLGIATGAAATSSGLYSAWTDCRTAACSDTGAANVDAARTVPVSFTASVAGPTVDARSAGFSVVAPTPFTTAIDANVGVTVLASSWTPLANTTGYIGVFANFSGAVVSSNNPVSFDLGAGAGVEAHYLFSRASWIAGTVVPGTAAPNATLDGVPLVLTPSGGSGVAFNLSVEPGLVYRLNVSAPDYGNQTVLLPAITGQTTSVQISLVRDPAWIVGRLEPLSATLTVDGVDVAAAPSTGLFNTSVAWGPTWVNASAPGLTSFSQLFNVQPNEQQTVDIALDGAWLAGSVDPLNTTVTLDGAPVPIGNGAFNYSTLGGVDYLNATAPGYAPYHRIVTLTAGQGVYVAISLNNRGWIRGTVAPVTASVSVLGATVPVVGGAYNVSVVGGSVYNVSVEEAGFSTQWANVAVEPSATHFSNFSLAPAASTCGTDCPSSGGGAAKNAGGTLPYSWTDAAVAAGLILGVALIAAVVVGLGGAPGPGAPRSRSPPATSNPSAVGGPPSPPRTGPL
jgi:hypothetical protein